MRTVTIPMFSWVSEDTEKGSPSRSLRVSIALAWDSVSTMTRRDLSSHVWKVTLPTCFLMHFWNWKLLFEYGAWARIWTYFFHWRGLKRLDKGRWLVVSDGRGWEEEGNVWVIQEEEFTVESFYSFYFYPLPVALVGLMEVLDDRPPPVSNAG